MKLYIFRCRTRPRMYGATRYETGSNLPTQKCSAGWEFYERVDLSPRGSLRFAVDTDTVRRQVELRGWYAWDESPRESGKVATDGRPSPRESAKSEAGSRPAAREGAKVEADSGPAARESAKWEADSRPSVLETAKVEADSRPSPRESAKWDADGRPSARETAKAEADSRPSPRESAKWDAESRPSAREIAKVEADSRPSPRESAKWDADSRPSAREARQPAGITTAPSQEPAKHSWKEPEDLRVSDKHRFDEIETAPGRATQQRQVPETPRPRREPLSTRTTPDVVDPGRVPANPIPTATSAPDVSSRNQVVWFDIPVRDVDRAMRFYSAILGKPLKKEQAGPGAAIVVLPYAEGAIGGALVQSLDAKPSDSGPLLYLNAQGRLDEVLRTVEIFGGKVIAEKQSITPFGFRAIVLDSEGNRIALHSM